MPQRPWKSGRKADAEVAAYTHLLDCWLTDSQQGRQLLQSQTLPEARSALLDLLAQGLLAMKVTDLPDNQVKIEMWPTALAAGLEVLPPLRSVG